MSPQVGTRTTALIGTILDMQLMVTPQATMLEVTSVRSTVAVRVAARTPEVEAETVVVAMVVAETVVVAVAVATDACPTEWAMDTRSLLPREAQATKS
jgi:hypothetical protein